MILAPCPTCGQANDRHARTAADGQPADPEPGDTSICFHCGAAAVFTLIGLRLPTPEEAAMIEADPDVRRVRAVMRMHGLGGRA